MKTTTYPQASMKLFFLILLTFLYMAATAYTQTSENRKSGNGSGGENAPPKSSQPQDPTANPDEGKPAAAKQSTSPPQVTGKDDTITGSDPGSVFRLGTFIGSSFKDIEDSHIFGKRFFGAVQKGIYNVPYQLEYSDTLNGTSNPYITQVGFMENKEAVYFLITKALMVRSQSLNDAEVESALYRVAKGGEWKAKTGTVDYKGTFYEYTHTVNKENFRLFAYRAPGNRTLIIYSSNVAPDFDGKAPPGVLLSFNDGQTIPYTATPGEDTNYSIRYIDKPAPLTNMATTLRDQKNAATAYHALQKAMTEVTDVNSVRQFSKSEFADWSHLKELYSLSNLTDGTSKTNDFDTLLGSRPFPLDMEMLQSDKTSFSSRSKLVSEAFKKLDARGMISAEVNKAFQN